MDKEYLDLVEFLPCYIYSQEGTVTHPLFSTYDSNHVTISYVTTNNQEHAFTLPRFLAKTERTFEVLGLLQAEMGKTQNGNLSFSNCEHKIIKMVMRWFEEQELLDRNQWRWSIKLNMQEPLDQLYKKEIEEKIIQYWLDKTNISSGKHYPKVVTYIKKVPHTCLKDHYYGTLVLEYKQNLFSQIIKEFVRKITYDKILTYSEFCVRGFMRGIIAGEGSIANDKKSKSYSVHISATKHEERKIYQTCLEKLSIEVKVYNNYKEMLISNRKNLIQLLIQRLMTTSKSKYCAFLSMIQKYTLVKEQTGYFIGKKQHVWNKYPQDKIDTILKLYSEGVQSTKQLAKDVGVSKLKVNRVLKEHNLGKRIIQTDEEKRKEIAAYAFQHPELTQLQIAIHFRVSDSVVRRSIKKYSFNLLSHETKK